jgi:hypothetical protein
MWSVLKMYVMWHFNRGIKKMIHFSSVDAFNRFPIDQPLLEDKDLVKDKNAIPYDLSKADAQRVVLEYLSSTLGS